MVLPNLTYDGDGPSQRAVAVGRAQCACGVARHFGGLCVRTVAVRPLVGECGEPVVGSCVVV